MKLTKIHRVLQFDESPWLAKYIDFNTKKRKEAKNDCEKDYSKLMNNAVFGKTVEHLRKRINLKLTSNEDIYTKHTSIANFISGKMFNENLFAINRIKEELVLNRPIYVGMAILDLSKLLMYDFQYNYMLKKYDRKNIKLMFTDTDSLFYEIKTDDVYEDLLKDKELFDNSNYPKNSEFFFDENKKVIGKMKDEAAGMVIKEFIGLRSKKYSYEINNKTTKKCNGISKHTVNKDITTDDYRDTLFSSLEKTHSMKSIKSHNHIHVIKSCEITKCSLSCFDNKRYSPEDGITTLAYGHYKTKSKAKSDKADRVTKKET